MTVRFEVRGGKVVMPEPPISDEELTALEVLFRKSPELKPERPDITQHWTDEERIVARYCARQLEQMTSREDESHAG